ncbi:hypothetical protein T11_5871 [Trichinella zimbabwensis]|uniref:PiggyBac transposable element-derived protein domain-containing protein n=1 Tax=Trichinella zimbabwensis TaxID=268475 RepID=A0A0V1H8M6_9BILA|nr:hypothetical protein T11_5871 [Trichinella zimbabwensis]
MIEEINPIIEAQQRMTSVGRNVNTKDENYATATIQPVLVNGFSCGRNIKQNKSQPQASMKIIKINRLLWNGPRWLLDGNQCPRFVWPFLNEMIEEINQIIETQQRMTSVGRNVNTKDENYATATIQPALVNGFSCGRNIKQNKSYDRWFKIRPLLDLFLARCKSVKSEEKQCIDESLIPYKGRCPLR